MKIYITKFKPTIGSSWLSSVTSETIEEAIEIANTSINAWNATETRSGRRYSFEILEYLPTGRVYHPEDHNEDE